MLFVFRKTKIRDGLCIIMVSPFTGPGCISLVPEPGCMALFPRPGCISLYLGPVCMSLFRGPGCIPLFLGPVCMSLFRGPGGILLFLVPGCIPLFTIITSVFATDVDIISDPFSTRVDVVNESLIPSDKPGHWFLFCLQQHWCFSKQKARQLQNRSVQ